MKTFRLIGMALITILMCITACSDGEDEPDAPTPQKPDESAITIDTSIITVAGTLRNLLGDQYLETAALKVIGPLNGDDIRIIREMGGSDYKGNFTFGKLSYLDLSDASIVKGGSHYYDDYYDNYYNGRHYTSNDKIGAYMFCNCSQLKTITFPNSVTTIEYDAFRNCTGLTSITIPNSVTTIGYYAFRNCTGLTSITIGSGITTIEGSAFSNCSIKKCHIYATTPPQIMYGAFGTAYAESTLYVPKGCVEIYKEAGWESFFYNIVEMD